MWMEETQGKRIISSVLKKQLATNAEVIASACPFCMTMMSDGVKDKEAGDHVKVKDIAEIFWRQYDNGRTQNKGNDASIEDFLNSIEDEKNEADSFELLN